jgi:hypothetical protein
MFRRLLSNLGDWRWKIRLIHPISRIPWSAIRRIGQSRLLGLTILVPFLGSLLLFNQHVVDVLTLSPELIKRWFGGTEEQVSATARDITLNRLYFIYFGLSFLGIASALFALFCPLEIKSHGSAREYMQVDGPLVTEARMSLIVPEIARAFSLWAGDETDDPTTVTRLAGEPDAFIQLFSEVAKDLYIAEAKEEERWAKENNEPTAEEVREIERKAAEEASATIDNDAPLDFGPYVDHRGYPDPWKIADALYSRRRVDQGFWYRINQLAATEKHRVDVLTLHYMSLDHSKPWLRLFVSGLYSVGFLLMLWPTGATFVQLATRVFLR